MTPQHVISQLLESDTKYPQNIELLKKIILTAFLARLQINSLPPDNTITLGNYLFDDERIMIDYTRLSDDAKNKFLNWLVEAHQDTKENLSKSVGVNEHRGFTAETPLGWWGKAKNWLQGNYSEHWRITDLSLSVYYQLNAIEICHGENGTLVGFNQILVPGTGTKYKAPKDPQQEPLGNTKRVVLTNEIADQLIGLKLERINFESICKNPHPQSIEVIDEEERLKNMQDYRRMQGYVELKAWYIRLVNWLVTQFTEKPPVGEKKVKLDFPNPTLLYENDTTKIFLRTPSNQVLVREKKPDIENLVFCGGGAKIFAHIGVWKALNEMKIEPKKFAGSSAGAIMSLLCYLGFTAEEISGTFKDFKQEHLVHFDIDRNGLSDTNSLKTALDYVIALKLKQIVELYRVPYPAGKISFATLDEIRERCPGCGIGEALIVTATDKKEARTSYFSKQHSPLTEVSLAVATSSCFPVLYKGRVVEGVLYNDGGVLNNFPVNIFKDDKKSTLIESETGNHLGVLAAQFDNGTERPTIDGMGIVYRENAFLNWVYSHLTGVRDPVSGWVWDRIKLRQYAAQSVVISADQVSASTFTVDPETQARLVVSGYEATHEYLKVRYGLNKDETGYENKELMYSTYSSLGELLSYCCYRANEDWFNIVTDIITRSELPNRLMLAKQSAELRKIYFNEEMKKIIALSKVQNPITFLGNEIPKDVVSNNHTILTAIYPIFLKLSQEHLEGNEAKKKFHLARYSLNIESPFNFLEHFNDFNGKIHIILHIAINIARELRDNVEGRVIDACHVSLKKITDLLYDPVRLDSLGLRIEYFSEWNLNFRQSLRILERIIEGNDKGAIELLNDYRRKSEPMKVIINGRYHEDPAEVACELESAPFGV